MSHCLFLLLLFASAAFAVQSPVKFKHLLYNVSIAENSPARTIALQPPGEESLGLQLPIYNPPLDVRFKIISGDKGRFFKTEERIVGDFCFLLIRTRTDADVLNRERKDKYRLEIKASASKHDGKHKVIFEANVTVDVTIEDTNDLNPLFYPVEYSVAVSEDLPIHSSILQISAEDADIGVNGDIYYSLEKHFGTFAVHPISGTLTITKKLRYSEISRYEIYALAEDRGIPPRSATRAKILVNVKQANQYAPEIYVKNLPNIEEKSHLDIYAIVKIVDKDDGIHGQIASLEIVDGDPDGHFRINPSVIPGEYEIKIHRLFQFQNSPRNYNLTLRVTDLGIPAKRSYKAISIHLTDFSKASTVFVKEIYEVAISENAPPHTPIIRLKVLTKDEKKNSRVFLEIVGGNEDGQFYINADTGMLYTAVPLDSELKAFYTLTVSAIDQGGYGPRKQSSAKVKINILDANDNDPVFDSPEMSIVINENEPPGTSVIRVAARDKDAGENAYISYSISNLNPVPFEIDHFSGVVRTTQIIDYESMKRFYKLRLRASDWGLPYRRQSEMLLKIQVKDINDNRPQFEKVDCVGYIPRFAHIGSEIITLSAIDLDAGNIITYRIVSGNDDNCFSLDSTSGILSVNCDLHELNTDKRELNVTATDGTHFADVTSVSFHLVNTKRIPINSGAPKEQDTGAFECKDTGVARRLTDVLASAERNNVNEETEYEEFVLIPSRYGENIHMPEFVDFPVEIKVNETISLGTTLVKLHARDRDLGYNGQLVFGISSGDNDSVFRIDPESGELKVIGHLDREREEDYYLNITVYDLGKPAKSVSKLLPITVLDVNDNFPVFERSLASFRVTENALNGTEIFRAKATDLDSGEFSVITYSLATDMKEFCVDPLSGSLIVCSSLDREKQDLYEIVLRATDGGGLYSEAAIRIVVDDVNDEPPIFTLRSYAARVREDVPKGTVVTFIEATDSDLNEGGIVYYWLEEEGEVDPSFTIDTDTGTIRTKKMLDFEERQTHVLTVWAADKGLPSLSSSATVLVEVLDVDENIHFPVFSDIVYETFVRENLPPGSIVDEIMATDADALGPDSRLAYYIIAGSGIGYFAVGANGQIRTLTELDAESQDHFWLTLCAQDHGVVPKHACTQVYIKVENVNDMVPMTDLPVYRTSIPEQCPAGTLVTRVTATDGDAGSQTHITYRIVAGNPDGLFTINSSTGEITTTGRRIDRESQDEHALEVQVSDNGKPVLSSTTRVVISIEDINDHAPEFIEKFYYVKVPATRTASDSLSASFQTDDYSWESSGDTDEEKLAGWETFEGAPRGKLVARVLAYDLDAGSNGEVTYSIKSGKGKSKFHIDPKTGVIVSTKELEPASFYELNIRATDGGSPPRSHTARVSVEVVQAQHNSTFAPRVKPINGSIQVAELDQIGFLVAVIQATDLDNDILWYDIIGGDTRNEFYIGRENGNILLAKRLVWEIQSNYTLNISVTDGTHIVYTSLNISVINDMNEVPPQFEKPIYTVDVAEEWSSETSILQPRATGVGPLLYALHAANTPTASQHFRVNPSTGAISVLSPLDREKAERHVLTISVRDQAIKSRRDFARVIVTVHDSNDHSPQFTEQIIQARAFADVPLGATVARVRAFDRDKGENARIVYAITGGNTGGVFSIDTDFGDIIVEKPLKSDGSMEYMLQVKASNPGDHALSASIPVHIMVTVPDNFKPRFINSETTAEIYENEPPSTFVTHLDVQSASSVTFSILKGNENGTFSINPSSGIVLTNYKLDYETVNFYNISVVATNMAGANATGNIVIYVLDRNDNAPTFLKKFYNGTISESAHVSSLVLLNETSPLVLETEDEDSEMNALRSYEIIDPVAKEYFTIDSTTGAIKTLKELDFEKINQFEFDVKVIDTGKPRLTSESTAKVIINIIDVNDCPPEFEQTTYNVTLLKPTYKDVIVLTVKAHDPDTENKSLKYDVIDGDKNNVFKINAVSGVLTVNKPGKIGEYHKLHIRVSDGLYTSTAKINVKVEEATNAGLVFQKQYYTASVVENSTKIFTIAVLNVLGSALNEHIKFTILNPTDMFKIGLTSGALQTTGKRFDRETKSSYLLIVEARSSTSSLYNEEETHRVAHSSVNVTVTDINDNCPTFVNLPYYAVVSVDDQKGTVVAKVHAIDIDANENGEVRFEMKRGHGELFKVDRKTGDISLKQILEGHNKDYQLIIGAYDGGVTPCYSEATVHLKVIDRSMPIFDKQFYSVEVPENIPVQSALGVAIQAVSPLDRKLIYTIVSGNEMEEFSLDFNTAADTVNGPCVLQAAEELDYEVQKSYELIVRATDSVTGIFAEVSVSVYVTDVNDNPPTFPVDSYAVTVSEGAPFGTVLLKVEAHDNDTGVNQEIFYAIAPNNGNASHYFGINPDDGSIFLKETLDRETMSTHHFTVVATDKGLPSLSSTVHIWVKVLDMNDNPPEIERSVWSVTLNERASRGQFIARARARDADEDNSLRYNIAGGNNAHTYSINTTNGVITLANMQKFGNAHSTALNISVTDGVYTSYTRVKISLTAANKHSPQFQHIIQEAVAIENRPPNILITTVKATDDDFGDYGKVSYTIPSKVMQEKFQINSMTGELTSLVKLDREDIKEYEVPIMASDGGGRLAFTSVRIKVGDENDNAPVFLLKEYKACVYGNRSRGGATNFLRVKATDADEGINAKIDYSIHASKESDVKKVFKIDSTTGSLSLKDTAIGLESQVYQFWVRATDRGSDPKHTDVPVEVYIMRNDENAPKFDRTNDKYFLPENSAPGAVLTTLKLLGDTKAKLRIVPGMFDPVLFSIDNENQLILTGHLDRETKESHVIGIIAEAEEDSPLATLTEITLSVLDENDNSPEFHSSPYIVTLAENVEIGTSVIKVSASDKDAGSNSEIRYSLSADSSEAAEYFAVDPYTGWITTLTSLDREIQAEHKFQVTATDGGHLKRTTRVAVVIRLQDYNDCPTIFKEKETEASVAEDALPGTVITRLETMDEDHDKSPVEMYILSGDPLCQFSIRNTGEVYTTNLLDRELIAKYELVIIVTDGLFTAHTKLTVIVQDINDNPPYCLRHRYYATISEAAAIGSYLLKIIATDADEPQNAKLRYYLTGNNSEHFSINKETGDVTTAISLDRETLWKYQLVAHVQDKDKHQWECLSELEIYISDINDNSPQFSMSQYSVTLPEDVEIGTLVTKVHASDSDIGVNRKVRYSLIDDLNGQFKITADSGIVTLTMPLDRETKSSYNLEVRATDQGTPTRWSQATVYLSVSDINDNPPEFVYKYYEAAVPEVYAVGAEVVRVIATSKDTGVNAEVYYSIISGNEQERFSMDSLSGIISIAQPLDYERVKDYFLTVQAIDGGTPPLSNFASVNITVLDSNDNPPIFTQSTYTTKVREDAPIGKEILQVIANDLDSGSNGRISYYIERGDRNGQFSIDKDTGYISVAAHLDRETQSNYVLEIHGSDNGIPVLSNFVLVNIDVTDANDNPPLFSEYNYTTVIQEDKPLGHKMLKFIVNDADEEPNADPYTFDFQSGNEGGAFRLEQDGTLRTATRFNHKIKEAYYLQIRVFDNGTPPLYSDTWVTVKIIEESQYPPVVTPLEININSYLDEYPGGIIGKVYATDQDTYDTLSYSISPTLGNPFPLSNLFEINKTEGTLLALPRLDVGEYRINVTVTDGKYVVFTIVKVSIELITEESIENAVIVRFREVNERDFVLSHRKGFIRAVRNSMNCRLKDIIIISVQPSSDDVNKLTHRRKRSYYDYSNQTEYYYNLKQVAQDLDVLFTVKKTVNQGNTIYFTSEDVRKALNSNLQELEESTKLVVEEIVRVKCILHTCVYGRCVENIKLDSNAMITIATDVTSLVCPHHIYSTECLCNDGYGGEKCETAINECATKPCPENMKCFANETGQGYECRCVEEYECEVRCSGNNCYTTVEVMSFNGKSYTQYRIDKGVFNGKRMLEDELIVSLRFKTLHTSGTLVYAGGVFDYIVLEIVNGALELRAELGGGEATATVPGVHVSDGMWHVARLERSGAAIRLAVDTRHVAHARAPASHRVLDAPPRLYLGARLQFGLSIFGQEEVVNGFIGCMSEVGVWGADGRGGATLERLAGALAVCPALLPPGNCISLPCKNGGICHEISGSYACTCLPRFSGRQCELDLDPCASHPCLHNGICTPQPDGGFTCACGVGLKGARCESGHWCGILSTPACPSHAHCEEGERGPTCRCHGYYGPLCQFDIDECLGEPCLNGATCINEPGSFRCLCPPDKTGMNCGNPLYSGAVTSSVWTWRDWSGWNDWSGRTIAWAGGACFAFLVIIIAGSIAMCCRRRTRQSQEAQNAKDALLNSNLKQPDVIKQRNSKMSNLEVQRAVDRPASCVTHDIQNNILNNLDTLRSYGSAGDELENIPADYKRNLNLDPSNNQTLEDALHKPLWSEQMHLQTFKDHKINNDLKGCSNISKIGPPCESILNAAQRGTLPGRLIQDPRTLGGYHWDCSDWCGANGVRELTEVAGSEVPDSSSVHSDDTNTSPRVRSLNRLESPVRELSLVSEDEGQTYHFNNANNYVRHPNSYLPHHTASDSDEPRRSRRSCNSLITMLEERTSLLGAQSHSDVSANVCEIEESDNEDEMDTRWPHGRPTITDV